MGKGVREIDNVPHRFHFLVRPTDLILAHLLRCHSHRTPARASDRGIGAQRYEGGNSQVGSLRKSRDPATFFSSAWFPQPHHRLSLSLAKSYIALEMHGELQSAFIQKLHLLRSSAQASLSLSLCFCVGSTQSLRCS